MGLGITPRATALPPASDVPEEILRTEIITQGRSPVDGTPLTPAEYAALLEDPAFRGTITPNDGSQPTAIGPISPGQIMINRLPVRELLRVIFPF
ncbi:glutathione S-transferase [Laspinema sp. A4]|nr:glutathione S-transferase [Laspinema sp. D2d]MCT7982822.1 glutathione S-transferase [Laspinema sp. D2d]